MKSSRRLRIDIITLFPEMFEAPLGRSIVGRARSEGLVDIGFVNPRDFTKDRHRTVDDRSYGGGPGMVLMAQPLYDALKSVRTRGSLVVYLSAQGAKFNQTLAREFSETRHLILLCGHYEGVDERILKYVDMEVSVGDFVLTGGEIPAMAVADAVTRLLPGVLADEAKNRESFAKDGLDHPHYTRPRTWRRQSVPKTLLSGDHAKIESWRSSAALAATRRKRPDLLAVN